MTLYLQINREAVLQPNKYQNSLIRIIKLLLLQLIFFYYLATFSCYFRQILLYKLVGIY